MSTLAATCLFTTMLLAAEAAPVASPPPRPIEVVLPRFERFGISTADQLGRSLNASWPAGSGPGTSPEISRPHAWMLSAMQDDPGQLRVWGEMARQDPSDLEAVYEAVRAAHSLHDFVVAEALLQASEGKPLMLRDDRGGPWRVEDLEYLRCLVIRDRRSAQEALPTCLRAVAGSGTNSAAAALAVGRAYLLLGGKLEALPFLDRTLNQLDSLPTDRAAAQFLRGVALSAAGKGDEAQVAWAQALVEDPGFVPADRSARGADVTTAARLEADAAFRAQRDAARLAGCGHVYLELGLKAGADRCFAAAQKLHPGEADAERIAHLAESDPESAMKLAEESLKRARLVPVLDAAGWVEHRRGRDAEARPYFEEALRLEPRDVEALRGWGEICRAAHAPECSEEPIVERGIPTKREVDRTALQLALSLVPLVILYLLLRRRLRS